MESLYKLDLHIVDDVGARSCIVEDVWTVPMSLLSSRKEVGSEREC